MVPHKHAPDSISGALSLVQQLHTSEVERLRLHSEELQREVQLLRAALQNNSAVEACGSMGSALQSSDEKALQTRAASHEKSADLCQDSSSAAAPDYAIVPFSSKMSSPPPASPSPLKSSGGAERYHHHHASPSHLSQLGVTSHNSSEATHTNAALRHLQVPTSPSALQPSYYHGATVAVNSLPISSRGISEGKQSFAEKWRRWIKSGRFDMMIGIVIILNAGVIGYDAALRADGLSAPYWMAITEYFFLCFYMVEFALRFGVGGRTILCNAWIHMDLALLACGIADVVVRVVIGSKGGADFLDNFMVIRVLRLARIARVFRLVSAFKTLWVLVNGLYHSLITLLWTFVLISIIMYCFAIFAIEVIREDSDASERYNRTVREHFNSLFVTCITLLQGVTLDSVGGIYKPVIIEYPILILYFGTFIFLVSIALMNLVTAIMVQSALDQSKQDKAQKRATELDKRKKQVKQLKLIFEELDTDNSSMLSHSELNEAPIEVRERLADITETDDLEELFKLLDYDGDGEVSIEEFCMGVEKLCQGKLELFNIMRLSRASLKKSSDVLQLLHGQIVRHAGEHGLVPALGQYENGGRRPSRRPSLPEAGVRNNSLHTYTVNGHHSSNGGSTGSRRPSIEVMNPGISYKTGSGGEAQSPLPSSVVQPADVQRAVSISEVVNTLPTEPANELYDL